MQAFEGASTRLIRNDRVEVSVLVKRLRDLSVELSRDLPPRYVFYSAMYGGFGLSDEFRDWFHKDRDSGGEEIGRDHDTDLHQTMKRFARDMLPLCPESFRKALAAYHDHNAPKALRAAKELEDRISSRETVAAKLEYVRGLISAKDRRGEQRLLEGEEGKKPLFAPNIVVSMLKYNVTAFFDDFDLPRLEEIESIAQDLLDRTDAREYLTVGVVPEVLALATAFLTRDGKNGKNGDYRKGGIRRQKEAPYENEHKAFLDAMMATGEPDWHLQSCLIEDEVCFAEYLANELRTEDDEAGAPWYDSAAGMDYSRGWFNAEDLVDVPPLELVGRMLASGRYCRLAIQDVPALSDWRIGQYDGMERVSWA